LSLALLVKIHASQINGSANCINMHTAEAREKGETEQRLHLLSAGARRPVIPLANAPPSAGPTLWLPQGSTSIPLLEG
jgi:AhpD family alkylhydroperoxidase